MVRLNTDEIVSYGQWARSREGDGPGGWRLFIDLTGPYRLGDEVCDVERLVQVKCVVTLQRRQVYNWNTTDLHSWTVDYDIYFL